MIDRQALTLSILRAASALPVSLIFSTTHPAAVAAENTVPFAIKVTDAATGRGVPLVELTTVNHLKFVTDSAGVAVIDAPELAGTNAWLDMKGQGYNVPADGFGFRGKRFVIKNGERATVQLERANIAERFYRITGGGIYADSVRLGDEVPIQEPLLNAGVLGQDSVQCVTHRGRRLWFWGDTNLAGYPLGVFHMTGAVVETAGDDPRDPSRGLNLHYFTDEKGIAKAVAPIRGDGPTWLWGFASIGDGDDAELYARFDKIKAPLSVYRSGLCKWDDAAEVFREFKEVPLDSPLFLNGHTRIEESDGRRYVVFGDPFPLSRVEATPDALADPSRYEGYTCLVAGSRLNEGRIERDGEGKPVYGWKRDTPATGPEESRKLIKSGAMKPGEALIQLRDRASGRPVFAARGSVCWNDYRKRWVMIATERGGTSQLGEVWYAEAPTSLGPWADAVKIVTHDDYSFYNPVQNDEFDQEGGRIIYFQGTYTMTFSGTTVPTPRYDYNQIMYRLDLSDPRLALPKPAAD